MKKALIGIIVLLIALPMVSMAASTKAATKYPIVLSHGMGANAEVMGITDYWGDIPTKLRNNGAQVFITSGNPMQSKEYKALHTICHFQSCHGTLCCQLYQYEQPA